MKDIAEALNVSRTTVSNILNDKKKSYRKATIDRVYSMAKELGYTTNNIAVSLKTGKTNSIALIVPDIANDFYINIIKEVENLSQKNNLNLVICITEESLEKENKHLNMLKKQMIDGILIAPVSYQKSLPEDDYPFKIVCFDRTTRFSRYPYVAINNFQTAEQLTLKLLNNNYATPLFLAGSKEDITNVFRLEGYKKALEKKAIKYNEENVIFNIYDDQSAIKKLNEYFYKANNICDCIFLSSNYSIYGVLKSLKINHLNNMPLAGFENFRGSEFLENSVYTAKQPDMQIARYGFDKLIHLLNGKQATNSTLKADITSNITR